VRAARCALCAAARAPPLTAPPHRYAPASHRLRATPATAAPLRVRTAAPRPRRAGAVAPRAAAVKTREGAELRDGIASFYDASTPLWDDVWGEHLHHGYYPGGKTRKDHQQAQVRAREAAERACAAVKPSPLASAGLSCVR
jgi:hypothetical protein